jgi:AcrR family transcriptional regulator
MLAHVVTAEIRRRPGGRSAKVRAAVTTATLELLAEAGPSGLSIAEVAKRAGVHETSIYRRWGTRDRLVLDALVTRSAELLHIRDTGSVRGDLVALGQQVVAYATSPLGEALYRTMAACNDDDGTAIARSQYWAARFTECHVLVERARDRGELPATVDTRLLLEAFVSPIHFRLLLTREAVDEALLEALAEVAVRGVTADR